MVPLRRCPTMPANPNAIGNQAGTPKQLGLAYCHTPKRTKNASAIEPTDATTIRHTTSERLCHWQNDSQIQAQNCEESRVVVIQSYDAAASKDKHGDLPQHPKEQLSGMVHGFHPRTRVLVANKHVDSTRQGQDRPMRACRYLSSTRPCSKRDQG